MDARTTVMLAVGMVILLLLGFCALPVRGREAAVLVHAPSGSAHAELRTPRSVWPYFGNVPAGTLPDH